MQEGCQIKLGQGHSISGGPAQQDGSKSRSKWLSNHKIVSGGACGLPFFVNRSLQMAPLAIIWVCHPHQHWNWHDAFSGILYCPSRIGISWPNISVHIANINEVMISRPLRSTSWRSDLRLRLTYLRVTMRPASLTRSTIVGSPATRSHLSGLSSSCLSWK